MLLSEARPRDQRRFVRTEQASALKREGAYGVGMGRATLVRVSEQKAQLVRMPTLSDVKGHHGEGNIALRLCLLADDGSLPLRCLCFWSAQLGPYVVAQLLLAGSLNVICPVASSVGERRLAVPADPLISKPHCRLLCTIIACCRPCPTYLTFTRSNWLLWLRSRTDV